MICLRPYQSQAIDLLRTSMRSGHRNLVYVSPTGSGKSVVFSELCRLSVIKGSQVLVVTHRTEIFKSTFAHLQNSGIEPREIKAGVPNPDPASQVIVSMVETLDRRLKKGYVINPNVIIVDEAHFQNHTKIITHFASPNTTIIGTTATPIGAHFYRIYTDLISNIDIPELISQGFLVPCKPYQTQDDISDITMRGGEYDERSMFEHYNKKGLYDNCLKHWKEKCVRPDGVAMQTLIFNCNIEHTKKMNQNFIDAGIDSRFVTSETPDSERDKIVSDFRAGLFPVLQNCSIFTTGTDIPSIEVVVINRCTTSVALWLQMQGRASRPYPNKKQFITIDMGRNHERLGLWNEKREWKLAPPKKKKKGAPACRECPSCNAMLPAAAKTCEFCGHIFPVKADEHREGVLVEVLPQPPIELTGRRVSSLSVKELCEAQKLKLLKSPHVWRIVRSHGKEAVKEFQQRMGYSFGWSLSQYKELGNSKYQDFVIRQEGKV